MTDRRTVLKGILGTFLGAAGLSAVRAFDDVKAVDLPFGQAEGDIVLVEEEFLWHYHTDEQGHTFKIEPLARVNDSQAYFFAVYQAEAMQWSAEHVDDPHTRYRHNPETNTWTAESTNPFAYVYQRIEITGPYYHAVLGSHEAVEEYLFEQFNSFVDGFYAMREEAGGPLMDNMHEYLLAKHMNKPSADFNFLLG